MGEASQRELAVAFDVTAASMSQMTGRLIDKGYIRLRSNPADNRAKLLSLSPKGEGLLDQVVQVWARIDEIIVEAIGAEAAEQIFEQTKRLRDALGGKAPGTTGAP